MFILEPPSPPQYVQVDELSSRSLKLSWTPPEDGNSPLKQYILQFKRASGKRIVFIYFFCENLPFANRARMSRNGRSMYYQALFSEWIAE